MLKKFYSKSELLLQKNILINHNQKGERRMKKMWTLLALVLLTVTLSGCVEQECPEGKCKSKPGPGAEEKK